MKCSLISTHGPKKVEKSMKNGQVIATSRISLKTFETYFSSMCTRRGQLAESSIQLQLRQFAIMYKEMLLQLQI